jgi:hypothetical protein
MKVQAFIFSLFFSSHGAFIVPMTKTTKSGLSLASQEPSIEALREAAAKARQEAERLRQVRISLQSEHALMAPFTDPFSLGIRAIDTNQ